MKLLPRLVSSALVSGLLAFAPVAAIALPINDIDEGDQYYLSLAFENELIRVTRVDRQNNRVKVIRKRGNSEWVTPNRLLSYGDSVTEDVATAAVGIALIACAFMPEQCKGSSKSNPSTETKARSSGNNSLPYTKSKSKPATEKPVTSPNAELPANVDTNYVFSPHVDGNWAVAKDSYKSWSTSELRKSGKTKSIATVHFKPIKFFSDAKDNKYWLVRFDQQDKTGNIYGFHTLSGESNTMTILKDATSIHALKTKHAIHIATPYDAISYLRFFVSSLQADEGVFRIYDSTLRSRFGGIPSTEMKLFDARIKKAVSDGWIIEAVTVYGSSYFLTEMKVSKTGDVEMLNDTAMGTYNSTYLIKVEDGTRMMVRKDL